jgi:hypothetical protein
VKALIYKYSQFHSRGAQLENFEKKAKFQQIRVMFRIIFKLFKNYISFVFCQLVNQQTIVVYYEINQQFVCSEQR